MAAITLSTGVCRAAWSEDTIEAFVPRKGKSFHLALHDRYTCWTRFDIGEEEHDVGGWDGDVWGQEYEPELHQDEPPAVYNPDYETFAVGEGTTVCMATPPEPLAFGKAKRVRFKSYKLTPEFAGCVSLEFTGYDEERESFYTVEGTHKGTSGDTV